MSDYDALPEQIKELLHICNSLDEWLITSGKAHEAHWFDWAMVCRKERVADALQIAARAGRWLEEPDWEVLVFMDGMPRPETMTTHAPTCADAVQLAADRTLACGITSAKLFCREG